MWEDLKENARNAFRHALSNTPGMKTLLVDISFRVVLDVLSRGGGGKAFFDEQGITQIQYIAPASKLQGNLETQLVFLLRPSPISVNLMNEIVVERRRHKFLVMWLPQCDGICTLEMERQGLRGRIQEVDLPLYLIPCEENTWSLCWEDAFHDLFIHKDNAPLTQVVRSLLDLEKQGLSFNQINARGLAAQRVKTLFDSVRFKGNSSTNTTITIDYCVLFDRLEDPISLLVTPLHYEGLLDATLDFDHGAINLGKKRILYDEFYTTIRDMDFDQLTTMLHEMTTDLQSNVNSARSNTNAVIATVLRSLSSLALTKQNLSLHIDLGQSITESSKQDFDAVQRCVSTEQLIMRHGNALDIDMAVEEALFRDPPLELSKILKLICLQCLVLDGLKEKTLEWLKTQLCHTYGFQVLPLLSHLNALGWLYSKGISTSWNWSTNKKRYDTIVQRSNISDISFMFPTIGYAPLSVRMTQVDVGQRNLSTMPPVLQSSNSSKKVTRKQRILVYYIGGITVAEIAAYRWLNRTQDDFHYIVATTAICNSTRLIQQISKP